MTAPMTLRFRRPWHSELKKFEVLDFAGICWPSLAFVALYEFLNKQKLASADKN